jgi:hypothetical protein
MGVQKQGHWEQSKHQGRLFGDTKWDGKEFHGRERIDYGMCGTKGKSVTGTTRTRAKGKSLTGTTRNRANCKE